MASFVLYRQGGRYVLDRLDPRSKIIPRRSGNFELEYWAFGLRTANQWRNLELKPQSGRRSLQNWRSCRCRKDIWPTRVVLRLTVNTVDHPSMAAAFGVLRRNVWWIEETMSPDLGSYLRSVDLRRDVGLVFPCWPLTAARLNH